MATVPHSYTADTLEEALRNTMGDPTSNPSLRWTAANCTDYLNRGMNQLALHIPTEYETSWEIETVAATRTYLLPIDFICDKRVEYVATALSDERTLVFMDEGEWKAAGMNERKNDSGEPRFYTYLRDLGEGDSPPEPTALQPKHIVLYPVPDAAKTLRVYGFKIPDAIAAGTTEIPELITPKLEAVIMYAAYLMSRDDRDDVRGDRFLRDFHDQVKLIRAFNAAVSHSRPMMLKPWKVSPMNSRRIF